MHVVSSSLRHEQNFGVWQSDFGVECLTWDESMHAILGLPAGGPRYGLDLLLARVHDEDRAAAGRAIGRGLLGHSPLRAAFRVLSGDGVVRHVVLRGSVATDHHRRHRHAGICVDVTDVVRAARSAAGARGAARG
ncbi:MAG TPA: PAS domain-containing protein [Planctomycetota bacterium]|nr:PAS domain-containing protein [Planctomycetota bacterium]